MKKLVPLIACICSVYGATAAEDEKARQAGEMAVLMVNQTQISSIIDKLLEIAMGDSFTLGMDAAQKRQILTHVDSLQENLSAMLPWDKIRSSVAAEYAENFSTEELDDILAFYQKGAGKKLLELQPELVAGIAGRVINSFSEDKFTLLAARNLTNLEAYLGEKERLALLEAKTSEPFPAEMLMGRWYGTDVSDPKLKSCWWYEKKADGSQVVSGLDLFPDKKTYEKYTTPGRFTIIGRLIVETNFDDPSFSSCFILEGVTKKELTYRMVDIELSLDEWDSVVDQREKIVPFEIPEGYKDGNEG